MQILHENSKYVSAPYTDDNKLTRQGKEYQKYGKEFLEQEHHIAAVILSGGDGSRLGLPYPKGLFPITENKTIFDLHIDRLKNLKINYPKIKIHLLIMTSCKTDGTIKEFIKKKNEELKFFEEVSTFQQGMERVVSIEDETKVLYLNGSVIEAPNGNGDFFRAVVQEISSFSQIEIFNVFSVDNVLAQPLDEVFIGMFIKEELEILNKAVKAKQGEKVGAFFESNNKIVVKEYSDMDGEIEANEPLGNICNHLFGREFIERVSKKKLKKNKAKKKVKYTDENHNTIEPNKPNGIKYEHFIFDAFEYANKSMVMCVVRSMEFCPLKNNEKAESDNPTTCRNGLKDAECLVQVKERRTGQQN